MQKKHEQIKRQERQILVVAGNSSQNENTFLQSTVGRYKKHEVKNANTGNPTLIF